MAQKFHFISGSPRSGSTLFTAIPRQNPRFQAGMSNYSKILFVIKDLLTLHNLKTDKI